MPAPIAITRQSAEDTARTFTGNYYRQAANMKISLSQLLERQDPTSERPENERGLDAYERMLKAAGIITQPVPALGLGASTWDEATDTPQKRAMLPEYFARCWRSVTNMGPRMRKQLAETPEPGNTGRAVLLSSDYAVGSLSNPWFDNPELRSVRLIPPIPLARLVARTTSIQGTDSYRSLFLADALGTDAYRMKRVAEAAVIPTTTLISGERTLKVYKFGRGIKTSYEQLRRQHIDRIAFLFQRMALQAEVDKVGMVINTVVNGDGNANTAASVLTCTALDAASGGALTLKAWLTFKLRFPLTYQPDVLLGQEGPMISLMLLPISLNNTIPFGFIQGMTPFGQLTPINDQWANQIAWGITADAPAGKLLGWQSGFGVERVVEVGGSIAEVERFATDQTQIMVVTEVEGYGVIDPTGAKILNLV